MPKAIGIESDPAAAARRKFERLADEARDLRTNGYKGPIVQHRLPGVPTKIWVVNPETPSRTPQQIYDELGRALQEWRVLREADSNA